MVTDLTYADVLRPCEKRVAILYDVASVVGGSLLIGLFAQIAVKPPFGPVPVTGQTLLVFFGWAVYAVSAVLFWLPDYTLLLRVIF